MESLEQAVIVYDSDWGICRRFKRIFEFLDQRRRIAAFSTGCRGPGASISSIAAVKARVFPS